MPWNALFTSDLLNLRRNPSGNCVILTFSGQKTLYQNNLNNIALSHSFLDFSRAKNVISYLQYQKNFLWEPNVKFHKINTGLHMKFSEFYLRASMKIWSLVLLHIINHIVIQTAAGAGECHQISSMWPWPVTMAPNRANSSALTTSTTSKKGSVTHVTLACTEMTV